jgi:hypothetical protein
MGKRSHLGVVGDGSHVALFEDEIDIRLYGGGAACHALHQHLLRDGQGGKTGATCGRNNENIKERSVRQSL